MSRLRMAHFDFPLIGRAIADAFKKLNPLDQRSGALNEVALTVLLTALAVVFLIVAVTMLPFSPNVAQLFTR